jgi:hypothetical protein
MRPRLPTIKRRLGRRRPVTCPPRCITHVTVGTLLHVARQPRLPAEQKPCQHPCPSGLARMLDTQGRAVDGSEAGSGGGNGRRVLQNARAESSITYHWPPWCQRSDHDDECDRCGGQQDRGQPPGALGGAARHHSQEKDTHHRRLELHAPRWPYRLRPRRAGRPASRS